MNAALRRPRLPACNLGIAGGSVAGGWTITHFGFGTLGFAVAALALCAFGAGLAARSATSA